EVHVLIDGATRLDILEEIRGEPLIYDQVDGFAKYGVDTELVTVHDLFSEVISRNLMRRQLSPQASLELLDKTLQLRDQLEASGVQIFSQHTTARGERKAVRERIGPPKKRKHVATGKRKGRPRTERADLVEAAQAAGIHGSVDHYRRRTGQSAINFHQKKIADPAEQMPTRIPCPNCNGTGFIEEVPDSEFAANGREAADNG